MFGARRRWLAAMAVSLFVATACGGSGGETVTVFAASSLTDAFEELAEAYEERNAGARVEIHFAATSTLLAQLREGAPADVFASASEEHVEQAVRAGLIDGAPSVFARNRLAVVVAEEESDILEFGDLARDGLRLIVGAPQVPIGGYTEAALGRLARHVDYGPDFVRRLRENVVSLGLSARHAASTVQLGEADAAIGYESDAANPDHGLRAIPLPDDVQVPILYLAGVVEGTSGTGRGFTAFLLSDEGAAILERHGLRRP